MYSHYLYWQYWVAPKWLLALWWNVELALIRFFSVPVMIKTLFSHWHKDKISYGQGTFGGILNALLWNAISRVIGMIIRLIVLSVWLVSQVLLLVLSFGFLVIFLLAPLAVAVGLITGVVLLAGYW